MNQLFSEDTTESRSTARGQLDGLDEKEIRIITTAAQSMIDEKEEIRERLNEFVLTPI